MIEVLKSEALVSILFKVSGFMFVLKENSSTISIRSVMIKVIFGFFILFQCFVSVSFARDRGELWKALPVQHKGRVKPFDTFSREILTAVYGRDSYRGKSAVNVILSWILIPDYWEEVPFILVDNLQLKEALGFEKKAKRFAPKDFVFNKKLASELIELQSLRQRKEERDTYYKELEKLEIRLILYESVKTGWLLKIQPTEDKKKEWLSLRDIEGESGRLFREALLSYAHLISREVQEEKSEVPSDTSVKEDKSVSGTQMPDFVSGSLEQREEKLKEFLAAFKQAAFKGKPHEWFSQNKISAEIFYNSLNPFRWAWVLYFVFLFLSGVFFLLSGKKHLKWLMPFLIVALSYHTLGMALRSYIMSRPPVSNMYETVLWVPWVGLIAGLFFYWRKSLAPFIASVVTAFFCLFLIDSASGILDGSLQPLEAVLRSNFWLSTHVLIITMSYAFFFVAFVLADMALIYFLLKKKEGLNFIKDTSHSLYRLIQWGVVGLAFGTVLGAIWADYSWGRFWGWDPKESWALISLLGYLAVLHGRLAGWIEEFYLTIASVGMFFLVVMAWYGVNFILGKGLHSYGFGTGGVEYVAGFFLLHLILCAFAVFRKRQLT